MRREALGLVGLAVAALATTFLPARSREGVAVAAKAKPNAPRIGLVFDVGGRGDKSFNDAAYRGLMRAQEELGADVSFLEPVGSEDREAALRLFAAQGKDLVIGVGFIFSSDVDAVAKDYPGIHFACLDYAPGPMPIAANVEGLAFRDEEGAFLVGAVAGGITRTKHVGFVGGMQNPLIRKFDAGYEAGVHATCPTCTVHAGYAGTTPDAFRDPAKGKALATSQIAAGADVLFHAAGATGHGVFEAAREGSVRAIGVDSDQHDEMPGTIVTSMVKRGDVVVFEAIRSAAEGHFVGGLRVFGLAEGALDYVKDGPHAEGVPAAVKARVAELAREVAERSRVVPAT
jgi:basic membrane protein A